jgi:hypothetical protein
MSRHNSCTQVTIYSSASKQLLCIEYGRHQVGFQYVQSTDTFLSTSSGFQPRFVCGCVRACVPLRKWTERNDLKCDDDYTYRKNHINLFVTSGTYICPTYKEFFQVRWDNSIPLFLHTAICLEVSLFRWTSQNAFSRETAVYKWYSVQCCTAALHDVEFRGHNSYFEVPHIKLRQPKPLLWLLM